jgi:DNA polymerase-3 subunit delta
MAALTLVVGDEDLLVARAISRALATATEAASRSSGNDVSAPTRNELAAGDCSLDDLAQVLSPSLFAEERLLVLRDLQDADKDLVAALVAFTEDPEPGVAIVATHLGGAKGKAALEALKGAGAPVVEVARIKTVRDREQFAIDEVRGAGATLDREAAADLVGSIGNDLRELSAAAQQLAADIGGRISVDDVATYYRGRAESTGFAVADRAVEGDLRAALETLRWAFATGLDPILVSSSLAANLRLIVTVGAAGQGSPDSLAGPLRMPAWKIRRAQGWLRRWRPDAVAVAVHAVATADADLKGAADDPAYAVERAVIAVATAASAAA